MRSENHEAGGGDVEAVERLREGADRIRTELGRVIVGQDELIEQLLIALFASGHCILEGVPGLAKTLMISTLPRSLALSFNRIQFTPDLMPSDITGTEVIHEDRAGGARTFQFLKGPVFANVILADTPNVIHVGLLAHLDVRVETIMGSEHFDLEEAQGYVKELDRARVTLTRKYFKTQPDEPTLYHMVLNMDKIQFKTAAEIIVHAAGDLTP